MVPQPRKRRKNPREIENSKGTTAVLIKLRLSLSIYSLIFPIEFNVGFLLKSTRIILIIHHYLFAEVGMFRRNYVIAFLLPSTPERLLKLKLNTGQFLFMPTLFKTNKIL